MLRFKILVLQALYNLSDEGRIPDQDRLSFMRFLGVSLSERIPDAKTIWLVREHLAQAGAVENLFARFDGRLAKADYGRPDCRRDDRAAPKQIP